METKERLPFVGAKIFNDLTKAYKTDSPYYWSDAVIHFTEEDSLITEEDIQMYIVKRLADNFSLVVRPVLRSTRELLKEEVAEEDFKALEDFDFLDAQLLLEKDE